MSWTGLSPVIQDSVLTSLAVAALIGLILLIRKPFARRFGPRAAYALWLLPLVRFVLPPLPASFSLTGWLGLSSRAGQSLQTPDPTRPATGLALPEPLPRLPVPQGWVTPDHLPAPEPSLWASLPDSLVPALLVAWIGGTLIWLGRSWHHQSGFRRLVDTDSEPASPAIQAEARRLAREIGLRQVPFIRQSLLCAGPLVTGLTRPVILLPRWFEEAYSAREQRHALAHELTHIKRGDLWAFQLARLVAATQWFSPLTYLALYAFRIDQEAACDSDVLRGGHVSPAAYGRTLVKAARLAAPADRRLATASLTLAHPIKERLIMLQTPEPTFRQKLTGTALAGALGTLTLFATASCMAAQADDSGSEGQVNFQAISPSDTGPSTILLGDPLNTDMSDLGTLHELATQIDIALETEIEGDLAELDALLGELDGPQTAFAEIKRLHPDTGEEKHVFIMKSAEGADDFEARIEAWAADHDTKAVNLEREGEALERDIEVIALHIERKTAALEADAEARAARIETALEPDFETRMEAAAAQIQSLHNQCAARASDDPAPEIVSATNGQTGETLRAVCVNGGRDDAMSDRLAAWVDSQEDLTDAEKLAFLDRRGQTMRFAFWHHKDEAGTDEGEKRIIIKRRHRIVPDAAGETSQD